ncbi:MAG: hypothetical protein K6E73_08190, partial [Bacteroidales bacterium]|nr:hypothetical protein [Bacteroidales bacterium]
TSSTDQFFLFTTKARKKSFSCLIFDCFLHVEATASPYGCKLRVVIKSQELENIENFSSVLNC